MASNPPRICSGCEVPPGQQVCRQGIGRSCRRNNPPAISALALLRLKALHCPFANLSQDSMKHDWGRNDAHFATQHFSNLKKIVPAGKKRTLRALLLTIGSDGQLGIRSNRARTHLAYRLRYTKHASGTTICSHSLGGKSYATKIVLVRARDRHARLGRRR